MASVELLVLPMKFEPLQWMLMVEIAWMAFVLVIGIRVKQT